MIAVRKVTSGDDHECCSACTETEPRPAILVVDHGLDVPSMRLCVDCARNLLNALAFMFCSVTEQTIRKVLGMSSGQTNRRKRAGKAKR